MSSLNVILLSALGFWINMTKVNSLGKPDLCSGFQRVKRVQRHEIVYRKVAPAENGRPNQKFSKKVLSEEGDAPDKLIATKFNNDSVSMGVVRQRPVCKFPTVQRFNGGDQADPNNWECVAESTPGPWGSWSFLWR